MKKSILFVLLLLTGSAEAGFIWDEAPNRGERYIQTISRHLEKEGTSMFYWNIMWGGLNEKGEIGHNIRELHKKGIVPDFFVLSEYKPTAVREEFNQYLNSIYPYTHFIPYVPGNALGLQIWSKKKYYNEKRGVLEWYPLTMTASEGEVYYDSWWPYDLGYMDGWRRLLEFMHFEDFALVPIHLVMPWESFSMRYGPIKTLGQLMFGKTNPLTYQIVRLKEQIQQGLEEKGIPYCLFGDTNSPKRMAMKKSANFKRLRKGLVDIFPGGRATYPAKSSESRGHGPFKLQRIKIDTAFCSKVFKRVTSKVLPMKGSDHYPIYFKVQKTD